MRSFGAKKNGATEALRPRPHRIQLLFRKDDQLASEALEFINAIKKTQLIVAENDRPVGVVHVHDFLRVGVA